VPACGFSIGFERVFTLMEERDMFAEPARAADVLIAVSAPPALADALRLGAELRQAALRVDVFPHATKLVTQFDVADRKKIPFAVIVGPEKAAALEVRDLKARHSTTVARDDLAAWLRARLT